MTIKGNLEEKNITNTRGKLDKSPLPPPSYGALNDSMASTGMEYGNSHLQENVGSKQYTRMQTASETYSRLTSTDASGDKDFANYLDVDTNGEYTAEESEFSSTGDTSDRDEEHRSRSSNPSFCKFFANSRGPPEIVFLCLLYALALGCTIGVVPAVLTDQYAKNYHGFDRGDSCANYDKQNKPQACLDGSSDSQTAAVTSSFVSNTLTFLTSSFIGSISDEYGRRTFLIISQFTGMFAPLFLLVMQTSTLNPNFYYIASGIDGSISWISIALSALSDVMPKEWRAPTFGILFSGFSLGFALSPFLALALTHYGVSILSLFMLVIAFFFSVFFLPETLSDAAMMTVREQRAENSVQVGEESLLRSAGRMLGRPIKELSILNRNCFFRLLSALAFFSGMSSSADQTLLLYYVEDRLNFKDKDVAVFFGIIGCLGIFVQGVLLKPFTTFLGERRVVVVAFVCGAITNTLYAFAESKSRIFEAACVSTVGTMAFPTISAMKANNVEQFEQGRIQGALFALSSLANAVGPALLRLAYQVTKNTHHPGAFFLTATAFFTVATFCAYALPEEKASSVTPCQRRQRALSEDDEMIEEALLDQESSELELE